MPNHIKRRCFLRLGAPVASFFGIQGIAWGHGEAEDRLARLLESRPVSGKPEGIISFSLFLMDIDSGNF